MKQLKNLDCTNKKIIVRVDLNVPVFEDKIKDYNSDKSFKIFKATVFSIRNEALPKATPGWLITDVEDIDWIGEVFNEEPELF